LLKEKEFVKKEKEKDLAKYLLGHLLFYAL